MNPQFPGIIEPSQPDTTLGRFRAQSLAESPLPRISPEMDSHKEIRTFSAARWNEPTPVRRGSGLQVVDAVQCSGEL